eukprot:9375513-Lingulodinium_polyedra.AAC.1
MEREAAFAGLCCGRRVLEAARLCPQEQGCHGDLDGVHDLEEGHCHVVADPGGARARVRFAQSRRAEHDFGGGPRYVRRARFRARDGRAPELGGVPPAPVRVQEGPALLGLA